jgi:hypothetical protein
MPHLTISRFHLFSLAFLFYTIGICEGQPPEIPNPQAEVSPLLFVSFFRWNFFQRKNSSKIRTQVTPACSYA